MTTRKYSSRSQQTTLSGALTSSGTSATVVSGTSLLGGATISAGETFTVVIDPDTALEEIVDVTAVSTNTLTITRGIDGSSGVAHSAGAVVRHMAIGRDYREANQHIENTTTAHGITLANIVQTGSTGTVTSGMILDGTIVNADINASAAIADTKLGTISTAGKVSNSATTATSANTNSAIVARDSSGNFSAGTITANLTGNVTGNVSGSAGSVTGNAATATALQTARNFQLTGDIEASAVSFDGTGAVNLVTSIGTGVINNADINASAAISYSKLNLAGTITSADIVNGTIVAADIADGTITAAKLTADPFARANHTGSQTASTISDFDTQVRTSRLDQMAAPTGSVSLNSQKITSLATPTDNTDASTKAYVDTQINNLIDGAPSTLNTLNEIAAALADTANFSDTVVLKAGSTMTGPLTLSGAPSSNLHAATKLYVDGFAPAVAADAAAAAASAAAAAASYDSFDDRYLGAKASAPSVDNDGNALVTGALYFNSVTSVMQVWSGSAWGNITSGVTALRWSKTAAGGETTINGADDNSITLAYTVGYEQVYLNGVLLSRGGDYTASTGSSITGLTALTAGDTVEVIAFTPLAIANALTVTTIDAKGDLLVGTAADTIGRLAVGTNGQYLVADSAETTGLKFATLPSSVSTLDLTINAQTGTTYTLVTGDTNKLVTLSNAGAITLTLPPSVFTAGQQIHIARMGAGALTLAQGAGVTIVSTGATASAPTLRAQYSTGTIICTASNTFLVIGDIA
jgi:hypothetical protein